MNGGSIFATSPSPTSVGKQPLPNSVIFATSGIGGCLGWVVVHPFNTLAVRSNLASASGQTFSLQKMLKQDGFRSLYDGLSAGVARQVFYATSRFGLFETGRDILHAYRGQTDFAAR
jgi:solute carrier family 25 (mitochondrial oxoglutarate transporter), member 11